MERLTRNFLSADELINILHGWLRSRRGRLILSVVVAASAIAIVLSRGAFGARAERAQEKSTPFVVTTIAVPPITTAKGIAPPVVLPILQDTAAATSSPTTVSFPSQAPTAVSPSPPTRPPATFPPATFPPATFPPPTAPPPSTAPPDTGIVVPH